MLKSWITIETTPHTKSLLQPSKTNMTKSKSIQSREEWLPLPHPGQTLKEDFMEPLGLSAYAVAQAIGSTPITVSLIARGKRAISAEMALRLGRYTGTGPEFWQNLQASYDLHVARQRKEAEIEKRVRPLQRAA